MVSQPNLQPAAPSRRPARDLIDAVLENMRTNLEPLKYSTLAPSRYVVYLHPDEYARIEGIVPVLQEQTSRALTETLERLNNRPAYRKYYDRLAGTAPPVENAAREWQIEFHPDADGELAPGDILIHSELMLPAGTDDLGAGQRTRRITTVHVGQKTTKREETVSRTMTAPSAVHARLRYEDNAGPHSFDIGRESIVIGRGGIAYRADVRIEASVDVSREHARIRRDPSSGAFFIIDLSTLGTTLNGQRLPKGYDEADGTKRENGVETPLPGGSRIGLADTVFLQFELLPRS
jgi:pSer/pThr/pTyr-binding forkhead associated (FHA) protein